MQEWSDYVFGEKGQIILAGAAGGIVRWLTLRQSWKDGIISIVVGGLCSLYLSPVVLPLFDGMLTFLVNDPTQRATFGGFVVGIGGIGIVGFILDLLKSWRIAHARKAREDESTDII